MTRIVKNCFIVLLMLLPVAAFADISSLNLHFFTPPQGDYSVSLLERTFGAVGNVLHGRGNQIIGIVLGVFNAVWVIVIGLGILFVVWDTVITAAQSGEMMQSRGKKTVFTILRIVMGFALVVPSKATGYSMAQNGVVWVVVQGVGLADQITQKLHDYLQAGGQTFTSKPSTSADTNFLMPIAANVLKAEVCMYKLQDIADERKKLRDEALKESGSSTDAGSELAKIGYSINVGENSGNITFGSKNPAYSPNKAGEPEYLNDCGQVDWDASAVGLPMASDAERVSARKTLAGYMQAAVTEMALNLQPVARELASLNSSDTTSADSIAQRAATAMAGAGTSFATLLDPLKKAVAVSAETELKNSLTTLNNRGWIFTPMMVIAPGLYNLTSIKLSDYAPAAKLTDIGSSTIGVLKEIDGTEKQQIITAMAKVDANYVSKANEYLKLMDDNSQWSGIDFAALYTGTRDASYLEHLNGIFDATKWSLDAGATAAAGLLEVPKGVTEFFKDVGDFFDADTSKLQNGIDKITSAQQSVRDMVGNASGNLDALVDDILSAKDLAVKGGMTTQLQDLTGQLGPLGPLYATIMTAMIGRSMESLEGHLFNPKFNAMASSIYVGGEMMVSAMESTFQAGKILFVGTLVKAAVDGLNQVVSAIPYVGGAVGGIVSIGSNLVHKGIETFSTFHIALSVMLFAGGVLLYIVVPLTFVVAFAAICLRWIGMVMINVLGAPIFCFNLIRSDGEGMIGRGERFLADLAKTALTPAILAIGAVAYLTLFNIGYLLITSILSEFLPMLAKAYNDPILVPVSLAVILMVFSTLMVYISQTLANLCTAELVNHVTGTIGDTIQHLHDQGVVEQMKGSVTKGSDKMSGGIKSMTSSGSGMGPKL
ncbi:MAG TPA: DotA/TraY family protein [Gammaproteobacteria bacterium]|nr:DotA/TraY family protein [Gammaproteobacteria bacterium]